MTQTVYLNGAFVPKAEARISPDDRGFLFGDGVYEVIRAYRGRLFEVKAHLERLARGLAAIRIAGVDATALGPAAEELLRCNRLSGADAAVYLQVTRGVAPRGHGFPNPEVPPTVYAAAGPFRVKADPSVGIAVITTPDTRWARCDIKSVALLPNCLANQQAQEAGATEAIFVRDGVALEGSHTSFFAILDGVVRTAPKSNYILPGITRDVVLELCRAHGIPAEASPIFLDELSRAGELFITGTTFEVMPVVRADGRAVGDGKPGPVTRRLYALFRDRTAR